MSPNIHPIPTSVGKWLLYPLLPQAARPLTAAWRLTGGSYHLHAAADELAPSADLAGDAVLLGQLLTHALSEEDSGLGLHEEGHTEIDGVPAHDVVLVEQAVGAVLG